MWRRLSSLPFYAVRAARLLIGLCTLIAAVALLSGIVAWSTAFTSPPNTAGELGAWGIEAFTVTLVCYLAASVASVGFGAVLGGLTASRRKRGHQPRWYSGAVRRGLELTGALPAVIVTAIWLSSHPGQVLPALLVVVVVQQVFEVGARVKAALEAPQSTWSDVWYECSKSAAQVATTLASGEIALIALRLSAPHYATWPSSVASYLFEGNESLSPSGFVMALVGTLVLPLCLFLAGPKRRSTS